jgi:hypothetical protein
METDELLDKIEELQDDNMILKFQVKKLEEQVERLFNVLNLIA